MWLLKAGSSLTSSIKIAFKDYGLCNRLFPVRFDMEGMRFSLVVCVACASGVESEAVTEITCGHSLFFKY